MENLLKKLLSQFVNNSKPSPEGFFCYLITYNIDYVALNVILN